MLSQTFIEIDHEWALFYEYSVSQIYFKLASIPKNRSSNFLRFTTKYNTLISFGKGRISAD